MMNTNFFRLGRKLGGGIGVLLLFLILSLPACKCKKKDCLNGICSGGACMCDFGWEGQNCDLAFRTKFLGTWSAFGLCNNSGFSNYSVTISASPTSDLHVYIDNLYQSNKRVEGEIDSPTTFQIASQAFDTTTISGSGEFDNDTTMLNILYTVDGFTPSEDCVAELTK